MAWLDPTECTAARDYLRQGRPLEAAKVLLRSKNRDHRAVRRLLVQVGQELVAQAEGEVEVQAWTAAQATLRLAAECAALDPRGLALQARIDETLAEKERLEQARAQERAKVAAKIEEARRLVALGEFDTALRILTQLPAADARDVIDEIQLAEGRFGQAVDGCRAAVAAGDAGLARHHWETIKQLSPRCPQLQRLAGEIARLAVQDNGSRGAARPVSDRRQRFFLEDQLVLSEGEIAVGAPHDEQVQLPVLGRVHRRHAVLCRDRSGWQIVVCRDRHGRPCPMRVNDEEVEVAARLQNGDRVALGDPDREWVFRLPVPGSWTAIWEAAPDSEGGLFCASGYPLKRAVLLADELRVQPVAPAHLVLKNIPCSGVVLRWGSSGLEWATEGGQGRMEAPGITWSPDDHALYLPGQLLIESHWDEAERLGRMLVSPDAGETMALKFRPWNA
ncbi:MAG: hypothetical protein GYA33_16775 [Thermogutta sp.]|nr:hypothetical protein [Thermogutta sp.]